MTKNRAQVFSHPALPGSAVLDAAFVRHHFPKHCHQTFSIGVIQSGVNCFVHRGARQYASVDQLCIVNPDELHTGETVTEDGWNYLNIFPSEAMLADAREALALKPGAVHFPASVMNDAQAAGALRRFAVAVGSGAPALEVEQRWLAVCALLFARHTETRSTPHERIVLPRRIAIARDALDGSLADNLSLRALAELCDVSPYHLARSFTQHVGLPPHAYHLQKRIEYAKTLIQQGLDLASTAAAAGFADQAHLTRHFRRHMGVTPGQFSVR